MKTLEEVKKEIALEYGRDDYRKDFEYGIGLNKFLSEFEFMDIVAKRYARQCCEDLRERIAEGSMLEIDNEGYKEYVEEYMDNDANPITSPTYRASKKHILETEIILP